MSRFLLLFLPIFLFIACQQNASHRPQRASDPWVFRSVMDGQPRAITFALHDQLWVTYSTETGAMLKAWSGTVNFDGAVYTTVHGPQPSSIGNIWMENDNTPHWEIIKNGKVLPTTFHYKGHVFEENEAYLTYELHAAGVPPITIHEQPEYQSDKAHNRHAFSRTFSVSGLSPNVKIQSTQQIASIASEKSITSTLDWSIESSEITAFQQMHGLQGNVLLTVDKDGKYPFEAWLVEQPMIENPNKVAESEAENLPLGYRIIGRSDCKSCHNTYMATVGPAYIDIARRYQNTEDNIAMLTQKIKKGGSGAWGQAVMSAHDDLPESDLREMASYIMSLDEEEEKLAPVADTKKTLPIQSAIETPEADLVFPGAVTRIYTYRKDLTQLADLYPLPKPLYEGILPEVYLEGGHFKELEDNFAITVEGMFLIPDDNNYVFRLQSDDGSSLTVDDKVLIDHDGLHGADIKDGEVALAKGYHSFQIVFFQGRGGKMLSLQWKAFGKEDFEVMNGTVMFHTKDKRPTNVRLPLAAENRIPGDGYPLETVHPMYDLAQARPNDFLPKVAGMDFDSKGRLIVSTWDAKGGVYAIEGAMTGDPSKMKVTLIASGLAEPLGLKIVNDTIYVLQKQELTRLVDTNQDGLIDAYQNVCNGWKVSNNFHEFAFGLVYQNGFFYHTLAIGIQPGGASALNQPSDRGKVIKINPRDGSFSFVAHGLRTPNGIGIGVDEQIFVADNQGDWLPACKILHVTQDAFFGSYAIAPDKIGQWKEKPPVVWLPQDEIGNSPSTPMLLPYGPFKGQMVHGEVTHGGVKRVFVEKVKGIYQGAVFRFIQGLEAGVNRMVWGPDSALYIGGIGSNGNWQQYGKYWYGLQRLSYNGKRTLDMLSVKAKTDGLEIEFTEPIAVGIGQDASAYTIKQWYYQPTEAYGGPKMDEQRLPIESIHFSQDRKKVFLAIPGIKTGYVVYAHLPSDFYSADNHELLSPEVWYTMNAVPDNAPGFRNPSTNSLSANTLTPEEQKQGWKLLFDGKTTQGWRNYRKKTIGTSWKVVDGALTLDVQNKPDGAWQSADGGDIITENTYENYELQLEWKIQPCGNSGIIFNVGESDKHEYVWQTGPEMQILDNTCHPDAKIETHRAGDLYDMIACRIPTVKPAGEWNKIRLIVRNGKAQHWLNGKKVVEYTMFDQDWKNRIVKSKFAEMQGFGMVKRGHIALQDHGDQVWFRNIKIKTF